MSPELLAIQHLEQRLEEVVTLLKFQLSKKDVFTLSEAALYSGMAESTVRTKCRDKKIAFSRPDGKEIYIRRADLEKYMTSKRTAAISDIDDAANDYLQKRPLKRKTA